MTTVSLQKKQSEDTDDHRGGQRVNFYYVLFLQLKAFATENRETEVFFKEAERASELHEKFRIWYLFISSKNKFILNGIVFIYCTLVVI